MHGFGSIFGFDHFERGDFEELDYQGKQIRIRINFLRY